MRNKKYAAIDGPIPGENLISDERNYPWRRAPDYADLNDAMEFLIDSISEKPKLFAVLNALENEITVAQFSQTIVMSAMTQGRFTLDFALLLAGPLAKYISILAEGYDVAYDMGVEEEYTFYPKQLVDASQLDFDTEKEMSTITEDEEEDVNEEAREGLMMAMREEPAEVASEEEQDSMLGYNKDEDEELV